MQWSHPTCVKDNGHTLLKDNGHILFNVKDNGHVLLNNKDNGHILLNVKDNGHYTYSWVSQGALLENRQHSIQKFVDQVVSYGSHMLKTHTENSFI